MPPGYGETPDAAITNSMKLKEKQQQLHDGCKDQANRSDKALVLAIAQRDQAKTQLSETVKRLIAEAKELDDTRVAEDWLMMACAYLGETNPHAALRQMYDLGASRQPGEKQAAFAVEARMARWKEALDHRRTK